MKLQNLSIQNNFLNHENRLVYLRKTPKLKVTEKHELGGEKLTASPTNTKTRIYESIEKAVRLLKNLDNHIKRKGSRLSKSSTLLRNHMMKIENVTKKLKSYLENPHHRNSKEKNIIEKSLNKLNTLIHKSSPESSYRKLLRKAKQDSMRKFYNGSLDNPKNLVRMFTLLGKENKGQTEIRKLERNGKTIMTVEKFGDQLFITKNEQTISYKFTIDNGKWNIKKFDKAGAIKTTKTVESKSETIIEKGIHELKTQLTTLKEGQALQVKLISKNGKTGVSTFVRRGKQIYVLNNGKLSRQPYDINNTKLANIMRNKLSHQTNFKIISERDVIKNHYLKNIIGQLKNLNGSKKNNLVIRWNGAIIGIVQRIRGHYIDRSKGIIPIFKNPNNKNIRIKNIASAFSENFKDMLAAGQISISTIQNRDWRHTEKSKKNLSVAEIANKIQLKNNLRKLRTNNQMVVEKGNFEGYKKLTIQKSGHGFKLANEHGTLGKIKRNEISELGKFINKNSTIKIQATDVA